MNRIFTKNNTGNSPKKNSPCIFKTVFVELLFLVYFLFLLYCICFYFGTPEGFKMGLVYYYKPVLRGHICDKQKVIF